MPSPPPPSSLAPSTSRQQYLKQTNQFLLNNFLKLAIIPIIASFSTKLRNTRVIDDSVCFYTTLKLDELRLLCLTFLLIFIATIFFMSHDLYSRLLVLQTSFHVRRPATILNLQATFEVESEEGGGGLPDENFQAVQTLIRVIRVLLLFDIIASFIFM